jgi:hypothetical protein
MTVNSVNTCNFSGEHAWTVSATATPMTVVSHILLKCLFTHTIRIVHLLAVQYSTSRGLLNPSAEAAHKRARRQVLRDLERCGA